MSRELEILAKQYSKKKAIVISKGINLYQTSINTAVSAFLRDVDRESRMMKQPEVTLLAVIAEPDHQ